MLAGRLIMLTFLGTSGAIPSQARFPSSIHVSDWNGFQALLDAGEGAQMRMLQAGLSPLGLDAIMITHSHGDHVNGLAGLLQSMAVNKRRRPLLLAGPSTIIEFALETLEATQTRLGFPVETVNIEERESVQLYAKGGDTLVAGWFKTCHTRDSYGFRLTWRLRPRIIVDTRPPRGWWTRADGRLDTYYATFTIVYTGDTAPCSSVVEAARGADVLVHEATLEAGKSEEAIEKLHSTSLHAALIAREAGVRLLVLTHLSARYREWEWRRLLAEAREVFPNTIVAYDLMRLAFRPSTREVSLSRILASPER